MKEKENSKDQKEFEELTEDELKLFNLIKAEKSKQIKELLNTELPPIKIWEYKTKENDGSTILHFAILYNNTKIISRIIKYSQHFLSQIDFINFINKKNKAGIIPIHYASYKGNVKIIDLLITCGSEVNTKTEKLLNVIHYSCQGNNPNCLLYYSLKYDFDFNLPDKRNSTPLHWACYSSAYECVNFLLQKNVNLNTQDIEGNTPLHLAIMGGMSKIVRLLLQKGSSIDIKNNSGLTPLQYALKEKRIEIYNIILTNKKWALCNLKAPAKKITKSKKYLLLAAIFKLGTYYFIITFIYPFLFCFLDKDYLNVFIFLIHLIMNISLIFLFIILICFNPGFVQNEEKINDFDSLLIKDDNKFLDFCFKCSIFKSEDVKHCIICDKCCKGFDHHCLWLDNCIGQNNHRFFIMILYNSFFNILMNITIAIIGLCVYYLNDYNLEDIYKIDSFNSLFEFIKFCLTHINFFPNYTYINIVLIIILSINSLLMIPLIYLLKIHIKICKKPKSTIIQNLLKLDTTTINTYKSHLTSINDDEEISFF